MKHTAIKSKRSLRRFYEDIYKTFSSCVSKTKTDGIILEIGSGSGFAKEYIPEIITSDVIKKGNIDRVIDARKIDFDDDSLKNIFLWDAFHHISDVRQFLKEAERVLKVGGRLLIIDPYMGILSTFIYKYLHHEHCSLSEMRWDFESDDPEIDANIALSWIVFERDLEIFRTEFPQLKILRKETHSLFRYWLCGGLKWWNLLPFGFDSLAKKMDEFFVRQNHRLASFWTIEIEKTPGAGS